MEESELYKELVLLQEKVKFGNECHINILNAVRKLKFEINKGKDDIGYNYDLIEPFLNGRALPSADRLHRISVLLENVADLIDEKECFENRIDKIRKELNIE